VSARPRVAITGVGAVTALVSGGASVIGEAIASPEAMADGARVDRTLASLVDGAEARRLSRVCQLTLAAARLAVADAGLAAGADLGIVVGTELGDLRSTIAFADGYLSRGPAGLSPLLFPNTVMNAMAASTAIALTARDVSLTIAAPTIAGELAIARAATAVASGRAPAMLAGGVDELDPLVAAVLAEVRGARGGRGEGAAFVVLERLDEAVARGARVLGEVLGTGSGALAAAPHGIGRRGTSNVVARALADAGLAADGVRLVLTGENGDEPRDAWEARVLQAEAIEAPRGPTVARRFGQGSAVGPLKVLAATPQAPALVHGLARGGSHVALVIGPASSSAA
jgi:3-oxoacyl-[acyl-carrier-protein] synthase II